MELERAKQFISAHRYAIVNVIILLIIFEMNPGLTTEIAKSSSIAFEGMSSSLEGFIKNIGCFGVFVIAALIYFLTKNNSGKEKKNEQKHETGVFVKCTKCKALNEEDAKFCKSCGEKI